MEYGELALFKKDDRMKKTLFILTIFLIMLLSTTCFSGQQWIVFHDKEIEGVVVTAEDGKPIESAIVIAMWALEQVPGQGFGGYAKILVTTTDKKGTFKLESWTTSKPWQLNIVMHALAPRIVIYKPGYKVYWSHSVMRAGFPTDTSRTKEENLKLKEKYSINPAKLTRAYTDEEILENFNEFESEADFSMRYYSKSQIKEILNTLEKEVLQISELNTKVKKKILKDTDEYRKHWIESTK